MGYTIGNRQSNSYMQLINKKKDHLMTTAQQVNIWKDDESTSQTRRVVN